VTIKVQIQTDAAAKGPEMERNEDGKISAEIIQGRPLAPNDLHNLLAECREEVGVVCDGGVRWKCSQATTSRAANTIFRGTLTKQLQRS
jgi:hypothetical protein